MSEAPVRLEREALVVRLHVQPGAKRSQWAGCHGNALKLRVAAPAVEGKANEALVRFLAEFCGVPRSAIEILQGEASRTKRVRIATPDPQAVAVRVARYERPWHDMRIATPDPQAVAVRLATIASPVLSD